MKKILSIFAIMTLLVSGLSFTAFADDTVVPDETVVTDTTDTPTDTTTGTTTTDTPDTPDTPDATTDTPSDTVDVPLTDANTFDSIDTNDTVDVELADDTADVASENTKEETENKPEVKAAEKKTIGQQSKAPKTGGSAIPYVVILTAILGVVEVFAVRKRFSQR